MKKKALIHIDYTKDFVAADGALTCGAPGQAIEGRITKITKEFMQNGEFVVFAIDIHMENDPFHPEAKLFPPHNMEGTDGRKLFGQLEELYQTNKDADNVYWMDKTRYSAFAGTDLELQLRARGISELHLVGVCTDICVLHTAVDAYNKGFELVVHEDAVASFDAEGHVWALRHFKGSLGAAVVKKEENEDE
ncbi:cysteine hydrolase family protein [Paenibacillus apiarius]|uniref:Cysteine hydrolase n=1 Tax=Paenibacillus apiarius TaxID=46240 RepID=A0ABT4DXQ1_9BACL|nr:isochorismatase family cysteine hydrolase [Paenibacillus apiarius]MCY9517627.1 cysteine hydrolase [Paenibacillus apiarius]MCY9522113.1 cysteine hydrolase [Paenibacillus apiarius]MCY9552598.1 cysteine hydrolase [Paenibacillus apiarius]MCY9559247.1 cysteine hydrolase [Paenibacillus apiarius]MCY9683670.1 cysteine hydrolase [Paenibacillus apiarius]